MPNSKKIGLAFVASREEYEHLRDGIVTDDSTLQAPALPLTYEEWLHTNAETKSLYEAAGFTVETVEVSLATLNAFAHQHGWPPNMTTLELFVMHLHDSKQQH